MEILTIEISAQNVILDITRKKDLEIENRGMFAKIAEKIGQIMWLLKILFPKG